MLLLNKFLLCVFVCCGVYGRYHSPVFTNIGGKGLFYVPKCDDDEELYSFEGQIVQVTRDGASLDVGHCVDTSNRSVAGAFDLSQQLHNVTALQVYDVTAWPPLPDTARVVTLVLSDVVPAGALGQCVELTALSIVSAREWALPAPDWLAGCAALRDLSLAHFSAARARDVIDSVPHLDSLLLDALHDWPTVVRDPLFPTPRGREQSISKVSLTEVFYRYYYNDDRFAAELNTTWPVVSAAITEQLATLSNLEELSISRLQLFDFCSSDHATPVSFPRLRSLRLSGTRCSSACFRRLRRAPRLQYLGIGDVGLADHLQFRELFSVRAPQLLVEVLDTEWIQIKEFKFDQEDYEVLFDGQKKANLTLPFLRISVECECASAWLARAVRERLLTAPALTCADGRGLTDQPLEWFECDKVACLDRACACRRDWRRRVLIAECHDAALPAPPAALTRWTNLSELLLSGNKITTIPTQLHDDLKLLDLSDNGIWQASAEEMAALFAVKERRIRLSGNPIVCTCDNREMLEALQLHKDQVEDYDRLTCVGDNTRLSEVDVSAVCAERDGEASRARGREGALGGAAAGAGGAALLLVAALYRRALRVFLFARGWCLCLVREDDLDKERRYDVFLSYCHADEELVINEILPVLDGEYSVCVHIRDFYPGEMIPTQIMWAVEQSRRTVVVLSRNFAKSLWGLLEFRTAYAAGTAEGRVRVIMIVLDDVLDSDDLFGELRAYVRLNTYVRWGDKWFWDKLRYSLPHRPAPRASPHPAPRPPQQQQSLQMATIQQAISTADERQHSEPNVNFQRDAAVIVTFPAST